MIVGDVKGVDRESQGRAPAVAGEFAVQLSSEGVPNTVLVSLFRKLQQLLDALGAEEHLKFTEVAHRNQVELEWSDGVVVLNMLKLQFAWMLSRNQQDDKRSRMGRRRLTISEVPPRRRFCRRGSPLSAAQQPKGVGRAPFVLFLSSSLRIAVDAAKLNSSSQGSSWTPPS